MNHLAIRRARDQRRFFSHLGIALIILAGYFGVVHATGVLS